MYKFKIGDIVELNDLYYLSEVYHQHFPNTVFKVVGIQGSDMVQVEIIAGYNPTSDQKAQRVFRMFNYALNIKKFNKGKPQE
jgi:hypothetical protein